jgi:hypothetical protein
MLDEGKINAQESAELLSALGVSEKTDADGTAPLSPPRKMALIGLALLLIGFYLPWFSINIGNEMQLLLGNWPGGMNPAMQGINVDFPAELQPLMKRTMNVAGGDVQHGLGWLVLLIGIAAATLPYVADKLSARDRRQATLFGLGFGGIILIYLLTQNIRFVSVGILLALAGYALQLMGTLKERQLRVG